MPILGNFPWLLWRHHRQSSREPESPIRELHAEYGPAFTLRMGSLPVIFVSDRVVVRRALVERGATFANRISTHPTLRFLGEDRYTISGAAYSLVWRRLCRNLISESLHPSRVRPYQQGRSWALDLLVRHLQSHDGPVLARESFQFALFALLLLMCFGKKLEETFIEDIKTAQQSLLLFAHRVGVFAFVPSITKYVFWQRRRAMLDMKCKQAELLVPLIRARRERLLFQQQQEVQRVHSYMDSLLELDLEGEGGRKLGEDDLVSLCAEFMNGRAETTATALEWIMANLMKHQNIQAKLAEEIEGALLLSGGDKRSEEVREEELQRMSYLEAVVMGGLRRHPPARFLLPHSVMEETTLNGYSIPEEVPINFATAEAGWDEEVWENPMEFWPERFLRGGASEGSKEMKMIPFGVGRRICPGMGLAIHLQYFVANLVWKLEWKAAEGEEVDLSESKEFIGREMHIISTSDYAEDTMIAREAPCMKFVISTLDFINGVRRKDEIETD